MLSRLLPTKWKPEKPYFTTMRLSVFKTSTLEDSCNSAAQILQGYIDREEISKDDLDGARGLAIFSARRVAMGASCARGAGIVVAHDKKGNWSLPSSFSMTFIGGGTTVGADFYTSVRLLNDVEFEDYIKQKWKCHTQFVATAGPWAWTALVKDQKLVQQHTSSKGVFGGVISGITTLREDKDLNAKFYGRGITPTDVFNLEGLLPKTPKEGVERLWNTLKFQKEDECWAEGIDTTKDI